MCSVMATLSTKGPMSHLQLSCFCPPRARNSHIKISSCSFCLVLISFAIHLILERL